MVKYRKFRTQDFINMDIWESSKLALFIWFVVPGFISIKYYQLLFPTSHKSSSELIVDAISYSCINYALVSWLILYVEESSLFAVHKWLYYGFYFFVFFISPLLIVLAWKRIRSSSRFQASIPHPTYKPWDFVFGQRKCYWVHIHLLDGGQISGFYGDKSFSSSAPAIEQIYIEQVWIVNGAGGLDRMVKGSAGALVSADRIKYIEFIDYNG
ncbi:DUF6338 family protein [Pseudomonas antarctica]|uniref:DUF6338 family protein n=1 Tax=Pseudomonas antarctica TaxID=219572 RepID=UPI003F7536AC